jgi:predicted adenylyl cyclase CyaB
MPNELEAKFKIEESDICDLQAKILSLGALYKGKRKEINEFFDSKDERLNKAGLLVRLRTINWIGKGDSEYVITYKGRQKKGKLKCREELEYSVSNPESAVKVFNIMGYVKNFSFEKKRRCYTLGDCLIEIDELPKLGFFCEIEGPTQKAIERVMVRIGFADAKLINKGYGTLIRDYLKNNKSKKKALRFQ